MSCAPFIVTPRPATWVDQSRSCNRASRSMRGVLRSTRRSRAAALEIRVWDSNSEVRYVVLPMLPLGTDGWREERLASIVTRDCMIGTGLPTLPDGGHDEWRT